MATKPEDYRQNYTKVHMNREVYDIAKKVAKAQNRTVANYIAHLVYDDVATIEKEAAADAAPAIPNVPGSKVK